MCRERESNSHAFWAKALKASVSAIPPPRLLYPLFYAKQLSTSSYRNKLQINKILSSISNLATILTTLRW